MDKDTANEKMKRLSQQGFWGDQGNGKYLNPVLAGDYSDPDVIRVGEDYYAISSTFQFSPGMIVLHSKDLVNWEKIGHVVDDLTLISPELNYDRMNRYGRGIWAGAIRYHAGKFRVYFCTPDEGFFMSQADHPSGPWEPLLCLWETSGWDDCCPFWDDDGQAYLLATHYAAEYNIHLFRMSADGKRLDLDSGKAIHRHKGSEANKLYKIDGIYYFFHSEVYDRGDESDVRVVMMLRSANLYGPYEEKELIHTHGTKEDREPNQGGLVQTSSGAWYFLTHQGTCGYFEGRTLHLLPVEWVDGWPIMGRDIDGDGVGEMVWGGSVPFAPIAGSAETDDFDDFDEVRLHPRWEWNYQPRADKWSLTERPGFLRLHACLPLEPGELRKACNTITLRAPRSARSEAIAKIDLNGMAEGQEAGLCHFGTQYATIGIEQIGGGKTLKYNDTGKLVYGPVLTGQWVWLRSQWDSAGNHRYSYSLDGERFHSFGEAYVLNWGHYRGDRIGIYCYNNLAEEGYMDIDWFRLHTNRMAPSGEITER